MRDTLSIRNVTKLYDDFKALDDVSLDVGSGEFMTLLGPSGSGKTTLLMSIAGFTVPTTGQIELDQEDITSLPPDKRNFGLVFQGYALFPHMTVAQNVGYPLRIRKVSKTEAETKVRAILDMIQLAHLSDRYPSQLSGGQQQRVALARAIVFQPELLLLDEPLSALDRALRKDLQQELKDIHDRVGTTFIYVTHDQEEALSMSDRIAILHNGQIVQTGTPEDLYEQPVNIFVANFLGKSNFLQASRQHKTADHVEYSVGNASFVISSRRVPVEIGQYFSVALRPERLQLIDPADIQPLPASQNRIPGVISKVSYFGQNYEVIVTTELAGDLMVTVPLDGTRPIINDYVQVAWVQDAGVALNGRPETSDDAYAR